MKIFDFSLVRYILVGALNTIVGFGIIFILMWLGIIPEIANLLGYCFGILFSYILNKIFTFKSYGNSMEFAKFVICMGVAYLINLTVLVVLHRIYGVNSYLAQIIAGGFYTLSGYLFSKYFVFKIR